MNRSSPTLPYHPFTVWFDDHFLPRVLQGDQPIGMGCLVADDLVLTVPVDGEDLSVEFPDPAGPARYAAELVVQALDDDTGQEAALIRIVDPDWAPVGFVPPRWAGFSGGAIWTSATIVSGDATMAVEVNPWVWRRPGRWDLRPAADVSADEIPDLPGAALFAGQLLIGLAFPEPADRAGAPWTAVPVSGVAALPEFRTPIEAATGRALHLAPVDLAGLVAAWTPPAPPRTAADLLDPARAVTPFAEPGDLRAELTGWCRSGAALSGVLLAGPPGCGKTRLARELGELLHPEGWLVGEVAAAIPGEAWLRRLARADRPALLIFDPADGGHVAARVIAEAVAQEQPRHAVRLMLVAREGGAWWDDWLAGLRHAGAAFRPEPVMAPVWDASVLRSLQAGFATAFATELKRLGEPVGTPAAPADDAELPGDGTILDAAIAALGGALNHWHESTLPHGAEAMDLALVCRPADRAEACDLLARLPGVDPASAGELADWIRDTCPPRMPTDFWGDPLPTRLRERRLASACSGAGFRAALAGLAGDAAVSMLALLAAATPYGTEPATLIAELLDDRIDVFGPAAIAAVPRTSRPGPLIGALLAASRRDELPVDTCRALAEAIPATPGALAELAAHLRGRLVDEYRRGADLGQRSAAASLTRELVALSDALAEANRPEDALAAATEAVDRYDDLRPTTPAAVLSPGLRVALHAQAARLLDLNRDDHPVDTLRRSVTVSRESALASPEHRDWLAADLRALADLLTDLGRTTEAIDAYEEAARTYLALRRDSPSVYREQLVAVLCGLSDALESDARHGPATDTLAEAVELYEELAHLDPPAYAHPLVALLEVLAERSALAGRPEEAAHAAERAVRGYDRLAEQNHDTTLPEHAEALRRLAQRLMEIGLHHQALAAAKDSVTAFRDLVHRQNLTSSAELSGALHTLALCYHNVGHSAYAGDAAVEAANGFRRLVTLGHDEYQPALVAAMSNAAALRGMQGVVQESKPLAQQAVHEADRLGTDHDLERGAALNNLAIVLGELAGTREDAVRESVQAAQRAVDMLQPRAAGRSEAAKAMLTLTRRLAAGGSAEQSVATAEQAAKLSTEDGVGEEDPALAARALGELARRYADSQRPEDAAETAGRARDAYRSLETANRPVEFLAELGSLSTLRARTGALPEATEAAEEAVTCYAKLRRRDPDGYLGRYAAALDLLAELHASAADNEKARQAAQEAVQIGRSLPAGDAAAQVSRLRRLAELTPGPSGIRAAEDAYELCGRALPGAGVVAQRELAASALLLSRLLPATSDGSRRLGLANTAVSRYERLADLEPGRYLAGYADALLHRSRLYDEIHDDRQASRDAANAVRFLRDIIRILPGHRPGLAWALLAYAQVAPEPAARRRALEDAVAEYRTLTAEAPEAFQPDLADALLLLANNLHRRGKRPPPEALQHREEATHILAALAEQDPSEFGPRAVRELVEYADWLKDAGRDAQAQGVRARAGQINKHRTS